MNPFAIGVTVFARIFGAAPLGRRLRQALPNHHLSNETKESVRLGMGLVATMAALVLGLLVASAKESYDNEKNEVIQMAAKIGYLDRLLAAYGPEAARVRALLRDAVNNALSSMWPEDHKQNAQLDPTTLRGEALQVSLHQLSPQTEMQQSLKAQALDQVGSLAQMRNALTHVGQ